MNIYKTFNIPFLVLFILMIIGSICSGVTSASGVSIENQNKNMVILLWITFAFGALIFLISTNLVIILLKKSLLKWSNPKESIATF